VRGILDGPQVGFSDPDIRGPAIEEILYHWTEILARLIPLAPDGTDLREMRHPDPLATGVLKEAAFYPALQPCTHSPS